MLIAMPPRYATSSIYVMHILHQHRCRRHSFATPQDHTFAAFDNFVACPNVQIS